MKQLVASIGHLKAQIMPTKKGMCKVYLNFNPINHVLLLNQIYHCKAIQHVDQVINNENGSGELLVRLPQNYTHPIMTEELAFLQRSFEQIFIDYIEA